MTESDNDFVKSRGNQACQKIFSKFIGTELSDWTRKKFLSTMKKKAAIKFYGIKKISKTQLLETNWLSVR